MKTIKEIADLSGISIRTLHYYDEIDLFKPTTVTNAGYRLYDDVALQKLQQILFFKELEFSLKDIKQILSKSNYSKNAVLSKQRDLLYLKRTRLDELILLIDNILLGDEEVSFYAFKKEEIITMCQTMFIMSNQQDEFNKWIHYFGSKKQVKQKVTNPISKDQMATIELQLNQILSNISNFQSFLFNDDIVQAEINKLKILYEKMFEMTDVLSFLLDFALNQLSNDTITVPMNQRYGDNFSTFLTNAIHYFIENVG